MSESSSESSSTSASGSGTDEEQLISDDQLPDDLNPEKNPLARDPDDKGDGGVSPRGGDEAPDPAAGA